MPSVTSGGILNYLRNTSSLFPVMSTPLPVCLPLDYYQILGLPPQCAFAHVKPAYTDRIAQVPRREFTATTLQQREQFLQHAAEVLADPLQREAYHRDRSERPALLLENHQLAVGLLMLYELGEFQEILKREQDSLQLGDSQDVRLVIALTHRAAAEESYRQAMLSTAFRELESAQKVLREGDCLPAVQQELDALGRRWRPERVLQLLAGPPEESASCRAEALSVLNGMLEEREGIEGSANDGSGLDREEFVQFIQYVRRRLTVVEQQELFEREASRPSAAAQYLAAQALIARGFVQSEPEWVRRARGYLIKLSQRQDVNLELAVCALLLGQVDEAEKCLTRCQEEQPLNYIRSMSASEPDLLPGLCCYSEEWLKQEVFPAFRDLHTANTSLQTYFARPSVQSFLEQLSEGVSQAEAPSPLSTPRRRIPAIPSGIVPVAGAAGLAVLLLGGGWLFAQRQDSMPVRPQATNTLQIPADPPPQVSPTPVPRVSNEMSATQADQVLRDWQQAKQAALGPQYSTTALQALLTGKAQNIWLDRARQTRAAGDYWKYDLRDLDVETVAVRSDNVEVVARVAEVANFYSQGRLQPDRSYDRPYRVRYQLLKDRSQWRIGEMKVL